MKPRVMLFFGYSDQVEYPRFREPENGEIYQCAKVGEFVTLTGSVRNHSSTLPVQAEIRNILLDEEKNIRSIYMLAKSEKDFKNIVEADDRWKVVMEGNP